MTGNEVREHVEIIARDVALVDDAAQALHFSLHPETGKTQRQEDIAAQVATLQRGLSEIRTFVGDMRDHLSEPEPPKRSAAKPKRAGARKPAAKSPNVHRSRVPRRKR